MLVICDYRGINIFAGVATADLPADKEAFTWTQYAGPWFSTMNMQIQSNYDVMGVTRAVLAGEYK